MLYLADWRSCLVNNKQLTDLVWMLTYFGPNADRIETHLLFEDLFRIEVLSDSSGEEKEIVYLVQMNYNPLLSIEECSVLDHVIYQTKNLRWKDFLRLVFSTYPVISTENYRELDLVSLANEYINFIQSLKK